MSLGLLKFFYSDERRSQFLNGLLYCNTPEFYRTKSREGMSDIFESCIYSYRKDRENSPFSLELSLSKDFKRKLVLDKENTHRLTVKQTTDYDSWMHCWFELREPKNLDELNSQINNIQRLRHEFGQFLVFLPINNFDAFTHRLKKESEKPFIYNKVDYSSNPLKYNLFCKSEKYMYQQEFRFTFGNCSEKETDHKKFFIENGFRDLIISGAWMRIKTQSGIITNEYL